MQKSCLLTLKCNAVDVNLYLIRNSEYKAWLNISKFKLTVSKPLATDDKAIFKHSLFPICFAMHSPIFAKTTPVFNASLLNICSFKIMLVHQSKTAKRPVATAPGLSMSNTVKDPSAKGNMLLVVGSLASSGAMRELSASLSITTKPWRQGPV